MDRNQATGLILISVMLLLYFSFFGGQTETPLQEETGTEQTTPLTSGQPSTITSPDQSTSLNAGIDAPAETIAAMEEIEGKVEEGRRKTGVILWLKLI